MLIIPTGDLEGCQDNLANGYMGIEIIPTGDLEGCQDPRRSGRYPWGLYQLGIWKAAKTAEPKSLADALLYQLGIWKAAKTRDEMARVMRDYTNWGFGRLLAQPEPLPIQPPKIGICQPSTYPAANR